MKVALWHVCNFTRQTQTFHTIRGHPLSHSWLNLNVCCRELSCMDDVVWLVFTSTMFSFFVRVGRHSANGPSYSNIK